MSLSLPRVLAELPAFLHLPPHRSKGLSSASGNRWQIILLIIQTACEYFSGVPVLPEILEIIALGF